MNYEQLKVFYAFDNADLPKQKILISVLINISKYLKFNHLVGAKIISL